MEQKTYRSKYKYYFNDKYINLFLTDLSFSCVYKQKKMYKIRSDICKNKNRFTRV